MGAPHEQHPKPRQRNRQFRTDLQLSRTRSSDCRLRPELRVRFRAKSCSIGLTSNGFAPANPTRREIPVPLILSFTCVQSPQESHNPRSDAACVRCTMACVHTADNTQSLRGQRLRGKHQQTNVFVGNTLTDSQRESVFSGTTALVGVILLPLPPITIAATYLREVPCSFVGVTFAFLFVESRVFASFTPCGAAGALHSCAEYSAQRYPCGEQQG